MKTLLLAISAISLIAGQEAPQLPQLLQQLPFFSQLQSLQEAFQHLQSSLPQEVMTQLQQSLPPLLASLLLPPTGRASVITAEELTEDQEKDISDFIRRCNGLFGGFNNYNTGNSGYGYGYNTGFN